jgi:hypothetical protein
VNVTIFARQSRSSSTSTSTRTFLRLLHAPPVRHAYPTCFLHTYPLPSLSPSLPSPLSATAWASSLGHSIAFARQPRSSFALYWAPIRVSSQHAIVETWISLAPSSSNLVSFSSIFAKVASPGPVKRNFVLTDLSFFLTMH